MGMVVYDNEFETKESKLELQQIQSNKMAADHRNSHWPPKRKNSLCTWKCCLVS